MAYRWLLSTFVHQCRPLHLSKAYFRGKEVLQPENKYNNISNLPSVNAPNPKTTESRKRKKKEEKTWR